MAPKIAYFAHDLADPAVERRIRMLGLGGAAVRPLGFRRTPHPVSTVGGVPAIDLGRTHDGNLVQRAASVVATLSRLNTVAQFVCGVDVILARNLEMLVLATRARSLYAPQARLVFECLDVHRMLVSATPGGLLLRFLETKLWRNVDMLLTSSPGFVRNYFAPRGCVAPVKIIENKLLPMDDNKSSAAPRSRPNGPPWRIGWFGIIRCRLSLDTLTALTRTMQGSVEVVIRGRPSAAVFANFENAIRDRPHIKYAGPYRNPDDLPRIYQGVHFAWAVDFFEKDHNSAWLLPNRVYESTAYGAVPIGLGGVETGTWLKQQAAGVVLSEPLDDQLIAFFRNFDQQSYARLAQAVNAIPPAKMITDRTECTDLVNALCRGNDCTETPRNDHLLGLSNDLEATTS
jgi:succinoglycan biosynthesis protein ExoL